ncbi:MAG: hypothetical protein HYZ36_07310, partial [Pedosphaera parvula]|nr:hypothetical protein [Pedosphaera parvula]
MLIFDQLKKSDPALRALSVAVLAGMGVLLSGLWFVQVVMAKRYQANLETQSFRTVRIPAIRGRILDRNGIALAENRPSYNVDLYLEEMRDLFQAEYRRLRPKGRLTKAEIDSLGRRSRYQVISNYVRYVSTTVKEKVSVNEPDFHRHYQERLALPLPVLESLTPQQVAAFWEKPIPLPGLDLEIQAARFYPFGSSAAHVLGYLQRNDRSAGDVDATFNYRLPDFKGVVGIEGAFDDGLRGNAGVKSVLVNNLGYRQSESIWAESEPGENVILTIDLPIQQAAERALQSVAGAKTRGAVVVLDPRNGEILALVSSPSFDPNHFPGVSHEEFARLNDPKLRPLFNRATQGFYPAGSIFKIITALAGLEAGAIKPNAVFNNLGFYRLSGRAHPIHDTAPPGDYDFHRAFIKSSNSYFIHHGLKAGVNRILDMGHRFHLGERTGIPTLQENGGFFPNAEDIKGAWFEGDTANLCIGQGKVAVNPLQMALMTAAIANGGKVFWPRLVDRIEPQDPDSGPASEPFPAARLRNELGVKPEHLELVRSAMVGDVKDAEGTGDRAAVRGMVIGGKTGTAEIKHGR